MGGCPSGALEAAQIASSGLDIAADLLAQGFRRGPLALIAQAGKEGEAEGRGLGQIQRAEVQQVAFDGEGSIGERWTGADVGDGIEAERVRMRSFGVPAAICMRVT